MNELVPSGGWKYDDRGVRYPWQTYVVYDAFGSSVAAVADDQSEADRLKKKVKGHIEIVRSEVYDLKETKP